MNSISMFGPVLLAALCLACLAIGALFGASVVESQHKRQAKSRDLMPLVPTVAFVDDAVDEELHIRRAA